MSHVPRNLLCSCEACLIESIWVLNFEIREGWPTMNGYTIRYAAHAAGGLA